MKLLLSIFLFLALAIIACQPSEVSAESSPAKATSTQADEAAIKQVFKQNVDKWNAADLDGMMANIANDFVSMPPGQPAVVGKEVLRSIWEKFLSENTDT